MVIEALGVQPFQIYIKIIKVSIINGVCVTINKVDYNI